jgi:CO/xanthine dehydrogenase Mo-binding subunit
MAAGPGGVEDVTETMVTRMRNGGMARSRPLGYDVGGIVPPLAATGMGLRAAEQVGTPVPLAATGMGLRAAEQVGTGVPLGALQQGVSDVVGAPVDAVNYALENVGVPVSDTPLGGSQSISNAIDIVKSLVQNFAAQGVPNPVKEGINAAIETYGIPIDVVNFALGRLGIPTSDTPIGGSRNLRETFGFDTLNKSPGGVDYPPETMVTGPYA